MYDEYSPFQINYVAGTLEETEMAEDLALLKEKIPQLPWDPDALPQWTHQLLRKETGLPTL